MTHTELVERAERWLKGKGCQVVVTKASLVTNEQPDALGYTASGRTTLVECKASRSDFLRDAKKWHRQGVGLGNWRYYLTVPDMVRPEEVPQGWGLLYCASKSIRTAKAAEHHSDCNRWEEMKHLLAEMRRRAEPANLRPAVLFAV